MRIERNNKAPNWILPTQTLTPQRRENTKEKKEAEDSQLSQQVQTKVELSKQ